MAANRVSKENRVIMLCKLHNETPPTYNDVYSIDVGNGLVYKFRPADWLSDIANNWLEGSRYRVSLSDHDKKEIEELPWFWSWINRLENIRERKRNREENNAIRECTRC